MPVLDFITEPQALVVYPDFLTMVLVVGRQVCAAPNSRHGGAVRESSRLVQEMSPCNDMSSSESRPWCQLLKVCWRRLRLSPRPLKLVQPNQAPKYAPRFALRRSGFSNVPSGLAPSTIIRNIFGHSWGLVYGEEGAPVTAPLRNLRVTSHVLHQDVPLGWYQARS